MNWYVVSWKGETKAYFAHQLHAEMFIEMMLERFQYLYADEFRIKESSHQSCEEGYSVHS